MQQEQKSNRDWQQHEQDNDSGSPPAIILISDVLFFDLGDRHPILSDKENEVNRYRNNEC